MSNLENNQNTTPREEPERVWTKEEERYYEQGYQTAGETTQRSARKLGIEAVSDTLSPNQEEVAQPAPTPRPRRRGVETPVRRLSAREKRVRDAGIAERDYGPFKDD